MPYLCSPLSPGLPQCNLVPVLTRKGLALGVHYHLTTADLLAIDLQMPVTYEQAIQLL